MLPTRLWSIQRPRQCSQIANFSPHQTISIVKCRHTNNIHHLSSSSFSQIAIYLKTAPERREKSAKDKRSECGAQRDHSQLRMHKTIPICNWRKRLIQSVFGIHKRIFVDVVGSHTHFLISTHAPHAHIHSFRACGEFQSHSSSSPSSLEPPAKNQPFPFIYPSLALNTYTIYNQPRRRACDSRYLAACKPHNNDDETTAIHELPLIFESVKCKWNDVSDALSLGFVREAPSSHSTCFYIIYLCVYLSPRPITLI